MDTKTIDDLVKFVKPERPKYCFKRVTREEYIELSNTLLEFHEIFYKFWTVGRPVLTYEIDTAAVTWDKKTGKFLQFLFNADFWEQLDNYERAFIIAHECLHVILNHGVRGKKCLDREGAIAVDLIVNHILTSSLGLKTTPMLEKGCFFHTIFKNPTKIPKNKSFEYYYNILKNNSEELQDDVMSNNHSYLVSLDGDEIMDFIMGTMGASEEEAKEIKDKLEKERSKAGTQSLDNIYHIYKDVSQFKPKWELLLKSIQSKNKSKLWRNVDQTSWIKHNRRASLLNTDDIMLPVYTGDKPDEKVEMWFFADISGSCVHLKDKFFAVARSIPQQLFDVRFHTFDTNVKFIPLDSKSIEGGGGTCFAVIEKYIQKVCQEENRKYPQVIVCISDGEGTPVKAERPKNWHWILTYDNKSCLEEEMNTVIMEEF